MKIIVFYRIIKKFKRQLGVLLKLISIFELIWLTKNAI